MAIEHPTNPTTFIAAALSALSASGTGKAKIELARRAASGVSADRHADAVEAALRKAGHKATAAKFAAIARTLSVPPVLKQAALIDDGRGVVPDKAPPPDSTGTKGPKGGGRRTPPGPPMGTAERDAADSH